MERALSTEDKIRRAEEIYNKRRENRNKSNTTKVNINNKKDIKLLKKMFIQILICLAIYSAFYLIKNNNYIFSEDFINKAKEVLAYDVNFQHLYNECIEKIHNQIIENQDNNTQESNTQDDSTQENAITENTEDVNKEETTQENGIGGATEENIQQTKELTQMEQDALDIKNSISFINPIDGTITSKFGWRNPTTNSVPKYHTGLDIANNIGAKIHSATDGEVILSSSEGDYRKPYKNTNK